MMRRLRVALPALRAGTGADVFTESLARVLATFDVDATIVPLARRAELLPRRLQPSISGFDLVHCNAWLPPGPRTRAPVVATLHGYHELPRFASNKGRARALFHRAVVAPRVREAIRAAAAVTAVSRHVVEMYRAEVDREIAVIPNFVDARRFAPDASTPPRRALFVGRRAWPKGVEHLPAIARALGDVELQATLPPGTWGPGAPANLRAISRVDPAALPALYRSARVLIVPSIEEGFGLVALEALACGTPVVGFRGTGLAEMLADGHGGELVEKGDALALAGAARRYLDDEIAYRRASEAARQVALRFEEHIVVKSYVALYEATLAKQAGT